MTGCKIAPRLRDAESASCLPRRPTIFPCCTIARSTADRHLEWARTTLETAGFEAPTELVPGDAESVIACSVRELEIDMLIMGAYGHSPLRTLLFGSKTSDLLRSARIPTLLLR